ncbi:NUDIX hydrolase [Brevundimonas sp. TWP2-3-4b1]|uniref:NUDIX hydrolase n=1 Tax=Brevundimonas sp. TWP2-3-4b1 TaxID=2804580 RepID=UPI003CF07E39
MPYTYDYPHPAVTTDIAVFTLRNERLHLLLIERGSPPFEGAWALPGGFLEEREDLDTCARRELREETGLDAPVLFHFANYSHPDRDPRGRTISAAYLALLPLDQVNPLAGSDAASLQWFNAEALPPLAFDHRRIVDDAVAALRARCEGFQILFALLPAEFTLTAFQAAYEAVTGKPADRRNLHKSVLGSGLLEATGTTNRGRHRPARLFRTIVDVGSAPT